MEVRRISPKEAYPLILGIHYAHRLPSISYAYGLFIDNLLQGIVTYGTPPSSPLRKGIAGDLYKGDILELNRLCLINNGKNEASFLVGRSLRLLPKNKFIVSFADPTYGHLGYIYQACNFKYYGLSAKRTDWVIKGKEHLHGQTIADLSRGQKNRANYMRITYGDALSLKPRNQKHRYIFVTGDRRLYAKIKYKEMPYPKHYKGQ